jgi:hypothetical protein
VAQTVVAQVLEERAERLFHPDSFGYRPGRSALDAVAACRQRFWKTDWVIDLDIQKFFDSVPWRLVVKAVEAVCDLPWVRLYVTRWLQAPLVAADGTVTARDRGTPQGSAITPPAQWITRAMVTLRIDAAGFLGAVGSTWAGWDAVADGDVVWSDDDVFDDEPQDALARGHVGGVGAVVELGEEGLDVGGEAQVELAVGLLAFEGADLVA